MTTESATSEYIEFLSLRGCISHVVSASPNSPISTLALTQRCLASGIPFPVPLPDGSVGVKVENGIPAALAALDLVINEVPDHEAVMPDDGVESVEATAEQLGSVPEEDDVAVDAPTTGESVSQAADVPQEAPVSEDCSAVGMPEDREDPVDEAACDPGERAEPDQAGGADTDVCEAAEPTMFVRSATRISTTEEALITDAPLEDEASSDLGSGPDHPETDNTTTDSAADDLAELLSAINARLGALEDQQAGVVEALGSLSSSIVAMESRQIPRPDATEFNRGMAKMTVAFAHTLRRIEESLETARGGHEDSPANVSECLADGFGALANAIRGMHPTYVGAATDLTMIASMQETLSHQLAKLIEATPVPQPPALEEFLMDVRHATAELLAEQARIAQAS